MNKKELPQPYKCSVKYKHIIPCGLLAQTLESKGRGFRLNEYLSLDPKSKVGKGAVKGKSCIVSYHPSLGKHGFVIDYCPYCGTYISGHMKRESNGK